MTDQITAISASTLQMDFMELLTTQLQNQDPLDPMKNEELTMQLATLSQLQQFEELNTKFDTLMQKHDLTEGHLMIGRVVDFTPPELEEQISGVVTDVTVEEDGVKLVVGPYTVALDKIQGIHPYTGQGGTTPPGGGGDEQVLIGDINRDGTVNDDDRDLLLENYGLTTGATWAQGDLTGDGAVNHLDYQLLMEHYGESLQEGSDGSGGTTA